jgi:hypothetical protein
LGEFEQYYESYQDKTEFSSDIQNNYGVAVDDIVKLLEINFEDAYLKLFKEDFADPKTLLDENYLNEEQYNSYKLKYSYLDESYFDNIGQQGISFFQEYLIIFIHNIATSINVDFKNTNINQVITYPTIEKNALNEVINYIESSFNSLEFENRTNNKNRANKRNVY